MAWCAEGDDGLSGWRTRSPDEIGEILERAYGLQRRDVVDRCHRGFQRVAACLAADDLALAGIEALMLRLPSIDDAGMSKLARGGALTKGGDSSSDELRLPAGQPGGGQWTAGGESDAPPPPPPRQPSSAAHHGPNGGMAAEPPGGQSRTQNVNGFRPDGAGGFVFFIPSVSAGQDIRPTEVHTLDATAFQVGWDSAGLIQLRDAKGNVYPVEGNLPAIEQFNATTGRALGVSIRAFPAVRPSSPDPVSPLVDLSNTAAGALVDAATWLQQPATYVPIAPEIAAGDPEFPMGAAWVETTDPNAFREWRPVSNLEVAADVLSIVGALAPVVRAPATGDAAVQVVGQSQRVAAQIARNTPGVATVSGKLNSATGNWLRAGVPTPIPSQVGNPLIGQRFKTFAELRASVWKGVADNLQLSQPFARQNLSNMERGYAPFPPKDFQTNTSGAGLRFNLHHDIPIEEGGDVYDLGNLRIADPRTHYAIHYETLKRLLEGEMSKLSRRDRLLELMNIIMCRTGATSEEVDQALLRFCANCPDPAGAMDLVVEDLTPRTDEELVDFALAMPVRDARDLPFSELLPSHPLRYMRPEE
jgi:hypothetical protein